MISKILNGVVALLGAAGLTQFPAFYQQYLQRLGGRLDQIRLDRERLLADAQAAGQTLQQHLEALAATGAGEAQQAAARELTRLDEGDRLQSAYDALTSAPALERPTTFAQTFDPVLAQDTLGAFVPAVPATSEALAYGGVGMVLALVLLSGTQALGRGVARRVRARQFG